MRRFEAGGARVVLLTQPAEAPGPSIFGNHPLIVPTAKDDADFVRYNTLLRNFAAQHPHDVTLIDLAARVCAGGPPCPTVVDGMIIRYDGVHYTTTGSVWAARWVLAQLAK